MENLEELNINQRIGTAEVSGKIKKSYNSYIFLFMRRNGTIWNEIGLIFLIVLCRVNGMVGILKPLKIRNTKQLLLFSIKLFHNAYRRTLMRTWRTIALETHVRRVGPFEGQKFGDELRSVLLTPLWKNVRVNGTSGTVGEPIRFSAFHIQSYTIFGHQSEHVLKRGKRVVGRNNLHDVEIK